MLTGNGMGMRLQMHLSVHCHHVSCPVGIWAVAFKSTVGAKMAGQRERTAIGEMEDERGREPQRRALFIRCTTLNPQLNTAGTDAASMMLNIARLRLGSMCTVASKSDPVEFRAVVGYSLACSKYC